MTNISLSINKGFQPTTDDDAILATLLQHEEDNFSKLTVKLLSQTMHSEQRVDQFSLLMIGKIAISDPPEDNTDNSRDNQISMTLQRFEEDNVQNLE